MSKRSLTDGEVALARSIYRDSIDYAPVRVYDRGYAFLNLIGDMSFKGNIYLPNRYHHDFSRAPLRGKRLFNHEMFHVWQVHNGVLNLLRAAAREVAMHPLDYEKAYLFRLEAGKDLLDYRFEQQAAIMDEYFLRKNRATPNDHCRIDGTPIHRCLNQEDDAHVMLLLKGVLRNFLKDPSYPRRRRYARYLFPRLIN